MEQISALLDGELDAVEQDRTIAALRETERLRDRWAEYCLIGDVLRGASGVTGVDVAGLSRRLQEEPTVLAPAASVSHRSRAGRSVWAYMPAAAAVMGVALVLWIALAPRTEQTFDVPGYGAPLADASRRPAAPVSDTDRAYLLAHHGYAGGGAVPGVAYYIRTVSAQGEDGR